MRGFGEKCPNCQFWMLTQGQWKTSDTQRVAIVQCLNCRQRLRFKIALSPLRSYRKKTTGNPPHISSATGRQPRPRSVPIASPRDGVDFDTYGLGERCPKCRSCMIVRTSRRISRKHRAFYLDCTTPGCGTRQRADVKGSVLPPLRYRFWPAQPIPVRFLLLLK